MGSLRYLQPVKTKTSGQKDGFVVMSWSYSLKGAREARPPLLHVPQAMQGTGGPRSTQGRKSPTGKWESKETGQNNRLRRTGGDCSGAREMYVLSVLRRLRERLSPKMDLDP